jgi:hypothetical protein
LIQNIKGEERGGGRKEGEGGRRGRKIRGRNGMIVD